jgi:hypothetical protein
MARLRPHQTAFTSGEVSPRLRGRLDTDRYNNGAAIIENFICHAHGGASKAPGTHYVASTKNDGVAALIPFEFNTQQAYVTEFGGLYIRFYRDGFQIETSPGVAYEIVSPYLAAEVSELHFKGTADTLIITHRLHKPQILTRTGHTAWTLTDYAPPSFAITAATAADPCVITVPSHTFSRRDLFDVASIVGMTELNNRQFRAGEIIGDDVTLLDPETGVGIDATAFTPYVSGGTAGPDDIFDASGDYPGAVTFNAQRVVFGGPDNNPHKIFGSRIGDIFNMDQGVNDADGYEFGITSGSGRVPVVQWLAAADVLMIGGAGSEFTATGGSALPITPTNIDLKEQGFNGSKRVQPAMVDKRAIFAQRAGKKVRDMEFQSSVTTAGAGTGYVSSEVSIISEHITGKGVTRFSFQAVPDPIIWTIREDGQLLGFTFDVEQQVFAWHRHLMGGTDAVVESHATIPTATGEQTWVIVKRTVNSATVRHIEYFDEDLWRRELGSEPTEAEILAVMPDMFYVHSGLSYDGAPATVFTGLDHLEGETITALTDGGVHPDLIVSSGQITLNYPASKVHAGLKYTGRLKTLPIGDIGDIGSSIGRMMSWADVFVLVNLSAGGAIAGEDIILRFAGSPMDSPPALFSGVLRVDDIAAEDGSIDITHDDPLPFTVLAVSGALQVND